MIAHLHNIIGTIGVGLIVLAYFLLQFNKVSSNSLVYLTMNLVGSSLFLGSLLVDWNLAGVILQSVWILISLYGIIRVTLKR